MEKTNFEPIFEKVQSRAKAKGAAVELLVERSEKFTVGFQKGKLDKFDSSGNHCAGLRVILNGSQGYSYTESLTDEAILSAFDDAADNAVFTGGGGDESRVRLIEEKGVVEELKDLFNDSLAGIPMDEKLRRARVIEELTLATDPKIVSVPRSAYTEVEGDVHILTSSGVRRHQRYTTVSGFSYCLARQGEENRMGIEYAVLRNAREFDPVKIAETAAKNALAKLNGVPPKTGRYPVVLDREVAADIFGLISSYFSGKSVAEGTSLFGRDLGKKIASDKLTIVDDPFYTVGLGSRAFDSEGAKSQRTPLVNAGELQAFLTNSVYAERLKMAHTANAARGARSELDIGVSNLVVTPGSSSLEDLLGSAPRVVYITDFQGYHAGFRAGSGDFSLQAEGELWENGKKSSALCNFVVSGNVRELLMGIEAMSQRVGTPRGSVITPDLLVRELSVAGA